MQFPETFTADEQLALMRVDAVLAYLGCYDAGEAGVEEAVATFMKTVNDGRDAEDGEPGPDDETVQVWTADSNNLMIDALQGSFDASGELIADGDFGPKAEAALNAFLEAWPTEEAEA